MKTITFSKEASIRHESELILHFWELLQVDPDLHWLTVQSGSQKLDFLELELDNRRLRFAPLYYELKPSVPWLESLPRQNQDQPQLLVVAPELSSRAVGCCKSRGISAIDLNGRAWLRAPGLLVDRSALPGRSFTYELEPRNIFVGKSARIIRCLLTDRGRLWTQGAIVPRTGASAGLVSRIVQHLISQGFAEKNSAREFSLRDSLSLLDAWAASDQFTRRAHTTRFAGFLGSPLELARHLQEWARLGGFPVAFTQWIAAWQRHPFTEPVVVSAYVPRLPDAATLDQLGLHPVTEGGKLWLHVPDDSGLLTETQIRGELTLATDAQIYLDLQRTGLRGPDAATALREWDGFCRP